MRIEDLRSEIKGTRVRISAMAIWEDCDRPTQEIYFETNETFAQDLSCNPHAFLVGCILPAMRHGEERIAIDEAICPELRNGLATAMGWLCHWYGPPRKPVRIEAKTGIRPPSPRIAKRAGCFLSGGIDSLAMLRTNRLDFPLKHPRSIKDCLVLHGFDIGGRKGSDKAIETFDRTLKSMSAVAEDAGVTLIPVFTNVRHLDDDDGFSLYEFHGAVLSSVAHAFYRRLTSVSIASTYDIPNLNPWGSHPLVDPNYSSAELRLRHDGLRFSRLDKVRVVAEWDVALQNVRVCTINPPGMLNCGKCEKCIRTMTELLVIGKLAHTQAFPTDNVSEELLGSVTITDQYKDACYRELIRPLREKGRHDLAEVIESKSAQFHKHLAWTEGRDWKGVVKRLDRKYLNASLFKTYKALREDVRKVQPLIARQNAEFDASGGQRGRGR